MALYRIIVLIFCPALALASEISFFDSKIDFWGDKQKSDLPSVASEKEEPAQAGKFPWKTYLDPKNKEFFREGDYTPPEPFMELARNPSDENIKNWFELTKKKNELARRLDMRMREYLAKNRSEPAAQVVSSPNPVPEAPLDPSRFKLRMYFESTCPHCKRMFGVLKRLQGDGFEVQVLQIDRGVVPDEGKSLPLGLATEEEVKKHGIKGVPFLLIADTKRKALLPPIQGYHDFDEVVRLLKSVSR